MSIRVNIQNGFMGELHFTIYGVGNMVNEQWVFGPQQRVIYKEGERSLKPTFTVSDRQNEFMLALKEAIRIYEGNTPDFSQGQLKATQYHLEDLRTLLKINK